MIICADGKLIPVPGGGVYLHDGPTAAPEDAVLDRAAATRLPGTVRVFLGPGMDLNPLTRKYLDGLPSSVRSKAVLIWPEPMPGDTVDVGAIREANARFGLRVHVPLEHGGGVPELVPVDAEGHPTSFDRAVGFSAVQPPRRTPGAGGLPPAGQVLSFGQLNQRAARIRPALEAAATLGGHPVVQIGRGGISDARWHELTRTLLTFSSHGRAPVVITYDRSAAADRLATAFGGVRVAPVADGLGEHWHAWTAGGTKPLASELTAEGLAEAARLVPSGSPHFEPGLTALVDAPDWPAVAEGLGGIGDVPAARRTLTGLSDALRTDPLAIGDPTDRRLPVLAVVLGFAADAQPGSRIQPTARSYSDAEIAVTGPLNADFALDYLIGRPVVERPPHPWLNRMLWDGLLVQAWLGGAVSSTTMTDLVHGVGDAPEEVANAAVFDAMVATIEDGSRMKAAEDLIAYVRCDIPPEIRLAWVMRKIVLSEARPEAAARLEQLINALTFCD